MVAGGVEDEDRARATLLNGRAEDHAIVERRVPRVCVVRDDSAGAKGAPTIAAAAHPEAGTAAVVAARLRVVDRTEAALGES